MLFVAPVVLFDMLKAKQLACVSESGQKCPAARSLSLRRAWIEMIDETYKNIEAELSLSLRRAWIEIMCLRTICWGLSRSPYGERGLKLLIAVFRRIHSMSLSLRRAWIEIFSKSSETNCRLSLSLRRAWIEITHSSFPAHTLDSRSPYGERGLK